MTAKAQWAAAESAPERSLAVQLTAYGIPFERQFYYAKPRRFRADFALPEHRLLIEVVGGIYNDKAHGSVTGILADIERLNHATRAGYVMLRFTPEMIRRGEAIQWIMELLNDTKQDISGNQAPAQGDGGVQTLPPGADSGSC